MNSVIDIFGKRILAVCCVVLIVLLQVVFVMPVNADAKAGEELEVRVQYEGEPGGKIRTKTIFSNSDLESIGAYKANYINITRVGSLMKTAAYVVNLTDIVDAADIDRNSVKSFTFRTTDGYTMTFSGGDYLGAVGWYYPNLESNSRRVDVNGGSRQMEAGALDGASRDSYPAIAILSDTVKGLDIAPSFDDMDAENSYRFLTGQTDLSYLRYEDEDENEAFLPTNRSDITAWDSVKYIYGIDIVLKGSPPLKGISLNVLGDGTKVGSKVQLEVLFEGDTMGIFSGSDVVWSSSDESIAAVDENGVVTIKKEGEVTITASAAGHSASVTLGAPASADSNKDSIESKTKNKKSKSKITGSQNNSKDSKEETKSDASNKTETKKILTAREISLGDEITPETDSDAAAASADVQALEAAEPYDKKTVAGSAAAALLACGGGAVFRVRRFRADMGMTTKGKH